MNKIRVVVVVVLMLGIVFFISAPDYVPVVLAAPSGANDTWYVGDGSNGKANWNSNVTFSPVSGVVYTKKYAFKVGYYADINPTPGGSIILVVDFGRQSKPSSTWGVDLPGLNGGYQTESWVKGVAQAFIDGYNAGHTTAAIVAIGTHNQNSPWTCVNGPTPNVDSKWYESGQRWGNLVNSLTPGSYTQVVAANDVEGWQGSDPNNPSWIACGAGTLSWYDGFSSVADRNVYNFGSNAFNEVGSSYWTQAQQYNVSWGYTVARVVPQMYCSGQAAPWVTLKQTYTSLQFDGVTSENATNLVCGPNKSQYSLSWSASWQTFKNALTAQSISGGLSDTVDSFFYPVP